MNRPGRVCTRDRRPFYDLAGRYLPSTPGAVVVDLGAGSGSFADHLNLGRRFEKLHLLDGNGSTVGQLRKRYPNAARYVAPGRLPFEDSSVDFVHSSHMIEHLEAGDLHKLIVELNRVLRVGGILAISAPMLWGQFYGDLTHVRPYHHEVFLHYLCGHGTARSADVVSDRYRVLDLVYRHASSGLAEDWESTFLLVDVVIRCVRRLGSALRIRKCVPNGYTLVLEKAASAE